MQVGVSRYERKESVLEYSKIIELEKEHKSLLKKKSIFDKSVVAIRNSIRDEYERLLFSDYEFSLSKDVEQNLWKTVFYKVIEEYRKRIRKHLPPSSQQPTKTVNSREEPASEELAKICESFRSFLWLSSKFYQDLIGKFQAKYNLVLDGTVDYNMENSEPASNSALHKSYLSCHRCLIFLGDLARYHRDLYGHPSQKDWVKAANYYQQALHLIPDNGNPHNQLAVLATYADDEFNAVYHYFMSLAVAAPFLTAKDNLAVLFEKNRQKFMALDETEKDLRKTFLIRFVRLHGILFTKAGLDTLENTKALALKAFGNLLERSMISEEIVLKVITLCIFSAFYIASLEAKNLTYAEMSQRAILQQQSSSLSFEFFHLVLKSSHSGLLYFGPVCVFLDYVRCHPDVLKSKPSDRFYQAMLRDLAKLVNLVSNQPADESPNVILSEELELRGFLPLRSLYRNIPFSIASIVGPSDSRAKLKMCFKVMAFSQLIGDTKLLVYDCDSKQWYSAHDLEEAKITPNHTKESSALSVQNKTMTTEPTNADDVDEEVILFKPGEGVKIESEPDHLQPAIGSGRNPDKSIHGEDLAANSLYASPSFDLFGASTGSTGSIFTKGFPQVPAHPTLTQRGLANNVYPLFSSKGTENESNGVTQLNKGPQSTQVPGWSSLSQQQTHSFFTEQSYESPFLPGSKAPDSMQVTPTSPWYAPSQPVYPLPSDPTSNPQVFPFPGQNQRYYKTKNPFIS